MKHFIIITIGFGAVLTGIMLARIVVGGAEDNWICENGAWVKHGKPVTPQPNYPCS